MLLTPFLIATVASVCGVVQEPDSVVTPQAHVLDGTLLRPSIDSIRSWRVENGARTLTSTSTRTVERAASGWLMVIDHRSANSPDRTVDSTLVADSDLRMLRKSVRATTDSALVVFEEGRVRGWAVPPGEELGRIEADIGRPVFPDDGLLPWLWTLLPLREGYSARIETIGTWDGELHSVGFTVIGSETIEHRGSTVDCWVVSSDRLEKWGIHGKSWVAQDSRRFLKSLGWTDNGTEYITEVW